MIQDNGVSVPDRATAAEPEVSALRDGIANADEDEISKAVRERRFDQLAQMLPPISNLILSYSEKVRKAQENYEADCAFLNELMTLASRITHAIVSQGAIAFDEQYAKAIEAGTVETERLDGDSHESAARKGLPEETP